MQLDGPLLLPRYFEKLYLAGKYLVVCALSEVFYHILISISFFIGNPWNCTRNFKWLLIQEKGAMVVDRDEIICMDKKYRDRHMLTVMNFKVVSKTLKY